MIPQLPADLTQVIGDEGVPALSVASFLGEQGEWPIVDVRSPAEYAHAHLPGALSLPLFTDEERARVGITYKSNGREAAIRLGFRIVRVKLSEMAGAARALLGAAEGVRVYCWRGGMRSASMGWFFAQLGYTALRLDGGYKAFRRFAASCFEQPRHLLLIGGLTGAGKTDVLHALTRAGQQTIDLEGLANHRGSAFGSVGLGAQPTQELFENRLAIAWSRTDAERVLWLEDEGSRIGRVSIPAAIFESMRRAKVMVLTVPLSERVERLLRDYSSASKELLAACVLKVQKRLGGSRTREAIDALERGDYAAVVENLLIYYDKTYRYSMSERDQGQFVVLSPCSGEAALCDALMGEARRLDLPL